MKTLIIFVIVILAIGGWFFFSRSSTPSSESDIISRNGLHWHANLNISILGESQGIPAGLGLERLPHNPMHTHDRDNVIHLEFSGTVKKDNLRIAKFFDIWGKTFTKDCIFDKCSGEEGQLKMLVNGKENSEFENYIMQDEDKIQIIFEVVAPAQIKEVSVSSSEFAFNPKSITIKAGERVKLNFKNNGSAPHNLTIDGLGLSTKTIGGGQTDTIEFTATAPGTYTFYCSVDIHRQLGMQGKLTVE